MCGLPSLTSNSANTAVNAPRSPSLPEASNRLQLTLAPLLCWYLVHLLGEELDNRSKCASVLRSHVAQRGFEEAFERGRE